MRETIVGRLGDLAAHVDIDLVIHAPPVAAAGRRAVLRPARRHDRRSRSGRDPAAVHGPVRDRRQAHRRARTSRPTASRRSGSIRRSGSSSGSTASTSGSASTPCAGACRSSTTSSAASAADRPGDRPTGRRRRPAISAGRAPRRSSPPSVDVIVDAQLEQRKIVRFEPGTLAVVGGANRGGAARAATRCRRHGGARSGTPGRFAGSGPRRASMRSDAVAAIVPCRDDRCKPAAYSRRLLISRPRREIAWVARAATPIAIRARSARRHRPDRRQELVRPGAVDDPQEGARRAG